MYKRQGEALALLWSDVDFKAGTLTISKTLSTGIDNVPVVHETKTKSGMRTIDIDRETLGILNDWRAAQKTLSMKGFMFPSKNGTEMSVSKPYAYFQRVAKKLGIKGTIHSCLLYTSFSCACRKDPAALALRTELRTGRGYAVPVPNGVLRACDAF